MLEDLKKIQPSDSKLRVINHAAKDYDMTYDEVEKIYNLHYPDNFYRALEQFIKDRASGVEYD